MIDRTPAAEQDAFVALIVEATNHFGMPHNFYRLHEKYFDSGEVLGRLSMIDLKLRLTKTFSFDRRIIAGLLRGTWGGKELTEESLVKSLAS